MAELLKGAPITADINEKIRESAAALINRGIEPTLALVRVGENDSDIYYERSAMRRCDSVGVSVRAVPLKSDVTQDTLISVIEELNRDTSVHGILVFRPLPKSIDDSAVRAAIDPKKDVDGITESSLAGIFTGSGVGYPPCTAEACMEILKHYNIDCTGKKAVVIGRSLVIGKPVSMLLMKENATVTICHTKTKDLPSEVRNGDIVIASAGKARAIGSGYFRPGQVVIDVGINTDENGNMCGDVNFDEAEPIVSAITPVPGGIGTVTTSVLIRHVVEAAEKSAK